jgi:hypothetical protein
MRLYLDDDSAGALLTRYLAQAGHDVEIPADVGLTGDDDPVSSRPCHRGESRSIFP